MIYTYPEPHQFFACCTSGRPGSISCSDGLPRGTGFGINIESDGTGNRRRSAANDYLRIIMPMMTTREEKLLYKNKLKQFCGQAIQRRIAFTREAMANAQSSANSEEKSSAGDKYETARAMSHLEKDMHARQLMAHTEQLSAVLAINTNVIYDIPVAGAFIQCERIAFFIAAGLGKQSVDHVDLIFLSPQSPLAQKMATKRTGDNIDFNGETTIVEIF